MDAIEDSDGHSKNSGDQKSVTRESRGGYITPTESILAEGFTLSVQV